MCCDTAYASKVIAVVDCLIGYATILYSIYSWITWFNPAGNSEYISLTYLQGIPAGFIWYGIIFIPISSLVSIVNGHALYCTVNKPDHCCYVFVKSLVFLFLEIALETFLLRYLYQDEFQNIILKLVTDPSKAYLIFYLVELTNPVVVVLRIYEGISILIVSFHKCKVSRRRSRNSQLQQVIINHTEAEPAVAIELEPILSKFGGTIKQATTSSVNSHVVPRRHQPKVNEQSNGKLEYRPLYPGLDEIERSLALLPVNAAPSAKNVVRQIPNDVGEASNGEDHASISCNSANNELLQNAKLRRSGELFIDDQFLAQCKREMRAEGIEWKRPFEITSNAKFIVDGTDRFDIKQGELGDCWFLAGLASLTTRKRLLEKVIMPESNDWTRNKYCGLCTFRFYDTQSKSWKKVVIDDLLPTKDNKLIYMHSQQRNEFWSPLVEKAYAKFKGGYKKLDGGFTRIAFEDLTGGTVETFRDKDAFEYKTLSKLLQNAFQDDCLVGVSILESSNRRSGLFSEHAYSLTRIALVRMKDGKCERLIRIRNPWGNEKEWNGMWSDRHHLWDLVDIGTRKQLQILFKDDGEFWFPIRQFGTYFDLVEICYI